MPDAQSLSSFGDTAAAQMQKPQVLGYQSPSIASPLSAGFEYTPQAANAHIPDLKNVMFPSDNPFAYPNQPISALESGDGQFSFHDAKMGSNDNSMFGTPTSGSVQMQLPTPNLGYDFPFQQALNDHPNLTQQYAGQGRQFSVPLTDILMQNAIGGDSTHLGSMSNLQEMVTMGDMPGATNPEDFWNRMNKGQIGMRTGLTPGVPSSMDEYFNSGSWNPTWGDHHYTNPQ